MSASQLVSGGKHQRGLARPPPGCVWGLQSWRPVEEQVNRCPQAGRPAQSGRAGGLPGAQRGRRIPDKPSRTTSVHLLGDMRTHALRPVAQASVAKATSLIHPKPRRDGEGALTSKLRWRQQCTSSITGLSVSQHADRQPGRRSSAPDSC